MIMSSNTAKKLITTALKNSSLGNHGAVTVHAWKESDGEWLWEVKSSLPGTELDEDDAELDQPWLAGYDRELTGFWTATFSW